MPAGALSASLRPCATATQVQANIEPVQAGLSMIVPSGAWHHVIDTGSKHFDSKPPQ